MWTIHIPALLSLFLVFAVTPVTASEPSSRNIDSGWGFRAIRGTDRAELKAWHPAQVPGVVHTDLQRQGLIPRSIRSR